MSRHGYSDDCDDNWACIRWRGAVTAAINGKRGQAFLRELIADLDAMPVKELIAYTIVNPNTGACCALGCVAKARGVDVSDLDVDDDEAFDELYDGADRTEELAKRLGIAPALARELVYANDEAYNYADTTPMTPAKRWQIIRNWAERHLTKETET